MSNVNSFIQVGSFPVIYNLTVTCLESRVPAGRQYLLDNIPMCSLIECSIHVQKVFSVKPHYLSNSTVTAENGFFQYLGTFHTKIKFVTC
jgi:hypothetical protein